MFLGSLFLSFLLQQSFASIETHEGKSIPVDDVIETATVLQACEYIEAFLYEYIYICMSIYS